MSYYQGQNPEQNPNEYERGYSSPPQQPNEQQQGGYNQPQGGYYQPGGAENQNQNPQQQPPPGNNPNYQQSYYNPPPNNQQQQWSGGQQGSPLTSLGLDPRLASALCYALFWVSGLIILFIEKQNREVRYHALQSVIFFGGLSILIWFVGLLPLIGFLLTPFLYFVLFAAWIGLMVTAYINYQVKIPVVSDLASQYVDRIRV